MLIFSKILKKDEQKKTTNNENSTIISSKENNLKEISLEKIDLRKKTLEVTLEKYNISNEKARVAVALDISGSMEDLYENGKVQELFERILPLALKFDDNGELDLWLFSNKSSKMESISLNNYFNYVTKNILNQSNHDFWGGTSYAPVMKDIYKELVVKHPSKLPTYVLFITDGNNSDKKETDDIIKKLSKHNIFWQFVGIGYSSFDYLDHLDNIDGRFIDNANFMKVSNLSKKTDTDLYNELLKEYPSWKKLAKSKGIL